MWEAGRAHFDPWLVVVDLCCSIGAGGGDWFIHQPAPLPLTTTSTVLAGRDHTIMQAGGRFQRRDLIQAGPGLCSCGSGSSWPLLGYIAVLPRLEGAILPSAASSQPLSSNSSPHPLLAVTPTTTTYIWTHQSQHPVSAGGTELHITPH